MDILDSKFAMDKTYPAVDPVGGFNSLRPKKTEKWNFIKLSRCFHPHRIWGWVRFWVTPGHDCCHGNTNWNFIRQFYGQSELKLGGTDGMTEGNYCVLYHYSTFVGTMQAKVWEEYTYIFYKAFYQNLAYCALDLLQAFVLIQDLFNSTLTRVHYSAGNLEKGGQLLKKQLL